MRVPRLTGAVQPTLAGEQPAQRAAAEAKAKAKILIAAETSANDKGKRKARPSKKRRPTDDELTEHVEQVVQGQCALFWPFYCDYPMLFEEDTCNEQKMLMSH